MYYPTIGLEIHLELGTKTKMFCGCKNDPEEASPNVNVCPICLAHPGALPTINREAVEATIKLGLALHGEIADVSHFDRKSYFYPDLPKGYQISQYEHPIVKGGELLGVRIRRIHLEEDTGSLAHQSSKEKYTLVSFNRAGVPLVELVTEPDIKSGKQAMEFAKELQLILRYLGISEADMEKGQMRIEANISISKNNLIYPLSDPPAGGESKGNKKPVPLGTKVEVKNINSFRAVGEAIEYELKRQEKTLEEGEKVIQETRGWDEGKKQTISQRTKEEAHDYRYLPEPDLPPLNLRKSDFLNLEHLKNSLPELPAKKRERFAKEYDLSEKEAEVLVSEPRAARFFEEAVSEMKTEDVKKCCDIIYNYLTSDLFGIMKERNILFDELKITPENFGDLAALVTKGELSSRMAKDVLLEMITTGEDPRAVMERKDMKQIKDESVIQKAIEEVIAENPKAVEDYKKGKENAFQFVVGKTMAKLKGQGNPEQIQPLARERLTK